MTDTLKRDDILELLEKLGDEQDEAVLEAARRLHAQITEAGMAWDDLLVPEGDDGAGDDGEADEGEEVDDTEDTGYQEPEDEDGEPPEEAARETAESLALIDKLLAKSGLSDDLREELEGYKEDIAEGEFTKADRRYVHALHDRLSKRG